MARPPLTNESLVRYARKVLTFANFTYDLAKLGTDPRGKTACTIFPYDCSRIWFGYNGVPAGIPHNALPPSDLALPGGSGMAHAELNALVKMDTASAPMCAMLTMWTPCPTCASAIVNSRKIGYVWYGRRYESPTTDTVLNLLRLAGITVLSMERLAPLSLKWDENDLANVDACNALLEMREQR